MLPTLSSIFQTSLHNKTTSSGIKFITGLFSSLISIIQFDYLGIIAFNLPARLFSIITWRLVMKIRHLALLGTISFFAAGNSWAINTNTNNNNNVNFGTSTFSLTTNNMQISQDNTNNPDGFCQFFSFSFGFMKIIQIIQGNSFSQTFGSTTDVEDPCL